MTNKGIKFAHSGWQRNSARASPPDEPVEFEVEIRGYPVRYGALPEYLTVYITLDG